MGQEVKDPLLSMEVRWFLPGTIPAGYHNLKDLEPTHEYREDRYLLLPGATTIGVKLRANNLELKYLVKDLGTAKLSNNNSGRISLWAKRSIPLPENYRIDKIATIKKERWLYGFGINSKRRIQPAVFPDLPILNGNIELCQLWIDNENWWTLCIAAYGRREHLRRALRRAFDYVASSTTHLKLTAIQSSHFPEWLNKNYGPTSPPTK